MLPCLFVQDEHSAAVNRKFRIVQLAVCDYLVLFYIILFPYILEVVHWVFYIRKVYRALYTFLHDDGPSETVIR